MKLAIRGYVKPEQGLWVAVCLDFCLAAQADTADEAVQKLKAQIHEYVYDALVGEDKAHGRYFLYERRAPLSEWLYYYFLRGLSAMRLLWAGQRTLDRHLSRWLWRYFAEALSALPLPDDGADQRMSLVKTASAR